MKEFLKVTRNHYVYESNYWDIKTADDNSAISFDHKKTILHFLFITDNVMVA